MSSVSPKRNTETDRLQRRASDPARSAWVTANAGSGKTEVLVQRVMRLMLDGAPPEEILCLTYTKAAAAEMTNRVFERLGGWITLDDDALAARIADLTDAAPTSAMMRRARRLFADALETPGGLKIQTIHAFCERLLHLFPFDANAPAHFDVLDEAAQADMIDDAIAAIISGRAEGREQTVDAFARVAEDVNDQDFRDLLMKMISARGGEAAKTARDQDVARLAAILGVSENDSSEAAIQRYSDVAFTPAALERIIPALQSFPGKINDAQADAIARIADTADAQLRVDLARSLFLTSQQTPRAATSLMTAAARKAAPGAAEALDAEAAMFATLMEQIAAIDALDRNRALFRVADAAIAHYQQAKARRGALDFGDLIAKARELLANPGVGPWILYKLDSRLSHILVDEAQDTSDPQWEIVRSLAAEFTAGAGARSDRRTIFAVGDEKQSIYGFQGAAPRSFAESRKFFQARHQEAAKDFESVLLKVSFRSAREVLSAVDRVFAGPERSRGLTFDDTSAPPHESNRIAKSDIGFVELWPLITKNESAGEDDYLDPDGALRAVDAPSAESPIMRLAARVALNCQLLIQNGDPTGRAVRPGDIMILVRRRNALFEAIIAQLKQIGVPVAGADRLKVAQHIAVRDCLASARVAIAPDDDYALACALKSPLLGFDDDDLIAIAPERSGRLIDAIAAASGGRWAEAHERLRVWRSRAALGPFAFFARLLEADGGRRALMTRLGAEAGDALDAFLARALEFERREGASLGVFAAAFEETDLEIKRDLAQTANEVRVMTAHAAKGLEAPIVILPDTTSKPEGRGVSPVVKLTADQDGAALAVWSAGAAPSPLRAARDAARGEAEDEHRRLLYVALTRARDGLIICGATGLKKAPNGCWYAHIRDALEEGDARSGAKLIAQDARDGQGGVEFWMLPDRGHASLASKAAPAIQRASRIPAWARDESIAEQSPTPPIAPSRAMQAADRRDRPFDRAGAAEARARGRVAHRLLELLPGAPMDARRDIALKLAHRFGAALDTEERQRLAENAMRIIDDSRFALLFGPQSRPEVTVAGPVLLPSGEELRVSGVIDRLAVGERDVLIGDYKTGARPPGAPEQTPAPIVTQLALYRALIAPLYPDRRARCIVVWTAGPVAHELPGAMLDAALARVGAKP